MMRETVDAQRADVQKWLPVVKAALDLSQNDVARYCRVHPSVFSRWLARKMTSAPCTKAVARKFPRLVARALQAQQERAS